MEQTLKLNKLTNKMEASIQIEVEREIFNRLLERHLTENNVDRSNLEEYAEALYTVSKVSRWLEHKRTEIVIPEQKQDVVNKIVSQVSASLKRTLEEPIKLEEPKSETPKPKKLYRMISNAKADALIARAMAIPVDQWGSLVTPLPPKDMPRGKEKSDIYYTRSDENKVLENLKKELEPVAPEKLEVIRDAVNNGRNR